MSNSELVLSIIAVLFYGIAFANSENADISKYPYHVSVEYNNSHSCSGALITELWVVTVASCVHRHGATGLTVRFATTIVSTGGEQLEVGTVIVHPDFDTIFYDYDIALLKLHVPLQFGDGKQPIVLPSSEHEVDDGTATNVTGWVMGTQGNSAPQLTVVSTPTINQTICKSSLPSFKDLLDSMLCAGHMDADAEVCQGDLGAPLVHEERLVGILSYGLGCAVPTFPAVYTRINSFVTWIFDHTGIIIY
ncbi:trypsin-1-like [Diprion similis]|uniref:trypsin-1-like n=1 Tax=Diprion similis TaxID=362088 RepID=UPI001EF9539E|nr:trypsin-1-like [Diprion similis]XP_046748447.1 trypsin-1-like [Diprion similis]